MVRVTMSQSLSRFPMTIPLVASRLVQRVAPLDVIDSGAE
jgi:hypothetical protein